ncbi:MAG: hypothetical protein HY360_10650 [Verrucomicrobia bacterium]|nr:hypothetical protein [Verrucomicrobiota bacterium]
MRTSPLCRVIVMVSAMNGLASWCPAENVIPVGNRTCLFLDDHFIAEQSGVKRTWHQGKPRPDIAIEEQEPWENWPTLWGSCFYDPKYKVYRMYYQTTLQPSGEPGISFRDNLCYAESKDAKTWVRPRLGLVDFNGSKDNNILISYAGPPGVMIDPLATDPTERLNLFTYFLKPQPLSNGQHGYCRLQSEDGIHWSFVGQVEFPVFAKEEESGFVDLFPIMWDDIRQCYLGNFRAMSTHSVGELASADGKTKNVRRRAVGITRSDHPLKGWSPSTLILKADGQDDQRAARLGKDPNKSDWAELYAMPMFTYGNHYFGMITVFELGDGKDGNGGGDLQLAYSNDGDNWRRTPERKTAVEHSTDSAGLFPNFAQFNPPLDMGDEIWIFYSENNGTHGIYPFEKSDGRIRAAVWRKDGFVSLDCAETGALTTKPLKLEGKTLRVNFKTQADGAIRVAVLDQQGKPLPGFDLNDCDPLQGDSVSQPLVWKNKSDIASLKGKAIRLRFELSKCQLWSFHFAP